MTSVVAIHPDGHNSSWDTDSVPVPTEQKPGPRNLAVIGLGYIGCVTAACLAKLGHVVTGVDTDEFKVRTVTAGSPPFYEPDLADIVREAVASGRLKATTSLTEGLQDADI